MSWLSVAFAAVEAHEDADELATALRERYALQDREQRQPAPRSAAELALDEDARRFLASQPALNASSAEQHTARFCLSRRGGCSWAEALTMLSQAHEALPPGAADPADYLRATANMAGSRPTLPLEVCERLPAASLDAASFFERHVVGSRPVILTGLLEVAVTYIDLD